jgi:hypothetical protein
VSTNLSTFSLTREFVAIKRAPNRRIRVVCGANLPGAEPPPPRQVSLREPPSTVEISVIQGGRLSSLELRSPLDPASSSRRWALKDRRGLVAPLGEERPGGIVRVSGGRTPPLGPFPTQSEEDSWLESPMTSSRRS